MTRTGIKQANMGARPRQVSLTWTPEQYDALRDVANKRNISISALLWEAGYKLIEGRLVSGDDEKPRRV